MASHYDLEKLGGLEKCHLNQLLAFGEAWGRSINLSLRTDWEDSKKWIAGMLAGEFWGYGKLLESAKENHQWELCREIEEFQKFCRKLAEIIRQRIDERRAA